MSCRLAEREHGHRLAGQRREIHLERAGEQPDVGRDADRLRSSRTTSPGTSSRASIVGARRRAAPWRAVACSRPAPRPPARPGAPGRTRTRRSARSRAAPRPRPSRCPPRRTARRRATAAERAGASAGGRARRASAGRGGARARSGRTASRRRSASWLLNPLRSHPRSRSRSPAASSTSGSWRLMDGKDRTTRATEHPGFARRTPPERRLDPLPVAAFSSSPRPCEAFC